MVQIGPLTAEICTFSGGWVGGWVAGEIGIKAISTSIDLNWVELSWVEVELGNIPENCILVSLLDFCIPAVQI